MQDFSDEQVESKTLLFVRSGLAKKITGIFISLALLLFLFKYFNVNIFVALVKRTRIDILALATVIFFFQYFFRTHRFNMMLGERNLSFAGTFAVVSLHCFYNNILPFRTGELSYLHFQKKYQKIPYSLASISLIYARILDIIALIIWACILFPIYLIKDEKADPNWLWPLIVLAFLFILIVFLVRNKKLASFPSWLVKHLLTKKDNAGGWGQEVLDSLRGTCENVRSLTKQAPFIHLVLVSMALWFSYFLYFYAILKALRQNIRFLESIFPTYGATIGNLLPINGLGSLGTYEAGMTLGQIAIGTEGKLSISIAFLSHAHIIIITMLAAIICWIHLRLTSEG